MTWDINKVSEQIRQDTARNIQQWKESFKQNSNKFDKGGSTKKKSSSDVDSSNKEQFIKEMNKELSLRPDLDTPAFKQYLMKIAQQESGYKANAQNPASSASGYFQLIKANQTTGDQWEDMIRLTRENLAAINRLSPSLKKMAAEKGLDKWDLLALAHFQGKGKLPGIIQGDSPKDVTGTSTATYLNRFRGGKGASKDYDYSYSAPKVQDVNYSDVVGDSSPREEEPSAPTENSFLKMINARVAETQAAMDALHEEMSGAKQNPSKSIFASNTEEESSLYNTARTPQYAQVPQQVVTSQDDIPFDSDTYYAALEQRYMPDQLSPLDELVNSYTQSNELALGGPVNPDNPIPNFAQYTHQKLPAVRYAEGGGMDIGFTPNTNVDFNVKPQEEVAPEMPVNTKPIATVNTNPSVGLGAFQGQELPSENVMFPGVANNKLTKEQLQQNTTKSWNENRDFNASPEFYDDYSWRVKKHHPEVTDEAFNAVKNTTPIVTRKLGTRLGQYQVSGQYVPWSGAVQVDKFNGLFPDIVSHEMGHAFNDKLNLTGTTTGGNLDKALLNKAYPTVHGVTDDDIDERRAVNTQLRSVIQRNSGKSKADLDTHIQNMTTEDMQKAVEGMHTDYLKKAAVNDLSLPDMKKALQDVAFNNRQQNPNYNIAAYGGNIYDGITEKTQQMNTPHLASGDSLFYDMVTDPITGETKYQNNDGTWLQEIHNADGTTSYINNNGQELVPSKITILPEPVITPKNGKITDGGLILDANNNPVGNAFTNAPMEKPLESVSPEFAALTLPRAAINGALKLTTQEAAEFAPTMIGAYKDGTLAKAGLDMAVGGLGADVVDNVSRGIYGKTWGEELADETGLPVGLTDFTNPGWFTGSLAKPLTPLADLINKGVTKGITAFDNAGKALDFYHYNPANYVKDKVSFYPHENSFTRGIGGTAGLQDLIESQVIRGNKLSDPNVEVFRKGPFGITLKMDKNTLLNSNREAHIPTIEYSKGNTQNPQGEKQQQIKKQLIDFFQQHGIKEPSKMTNDKWNDIWSDMSSQFWDEKGPGADQVGELAETFPETEFRDMTDDQVLDYISDMWVPNREVLQEEKIAPLTYHKLVSLPKILKTISEEMDEGIRIGTVPVDINKEGILKDITDIYTTKLEKMPVSQGATKPNVGGWYMKGIDKKIRIPRGEVDDTALAHEYHHAARDLVQNYLKSKNLSHLLSPYAKSRKGVYGSSDEYFPSEYDALGFLNMRNEDSESYTAMNEMGATTVGDLGYTLWKQVSEDLGKNASLDEFLSYVETMKNNKKLYPLLTRTNAYALDIEDYLNDVGNETRARRTATKRADAIWDTVQGNETEPAWHYSTNPDVQKALEDVQKFGYADMVNRHYKKFSFKDRWKLLRNNPELLTPSNTGDIIKWLLGENLRESAALLLKTEKGKDLFNTAMNKKLWEMFKAQTDVHTEELINEEIANVLSKLGAVGVPAAIGTTTVTQNGKALGGPLNLFADGGRAQFNKDYPGLAGIQFNVVPDTNFNARNVGFGNIEYMPQGEEGVQYTPDYYYPNPDPSTNNVVYNPNNYSSQQAANEAVALDAISHAGHQDATYDALHTLLSNEYPNEAVMQAKDMVGDDKVFEKEMKDPYSDTRQFTYPAAVDGQIRGYMFEGMHPDKNDPAYEEQNYYPYFREEFQKYESADANRYLSDLSRYVTTGKRPKYILPEVKVTGKKRK